MNLGFPTLFDVQLKIMDNPRSAFEILFFSKRELEIFRADTRK